MLYLIGGDRNKAYGIAALAFAEALRSTAPLDTTSALLELIARRAVDRCRDIRTIPSFDESDFKELPADKIASIRIVGAALQKLPFDSRAFLLLRDQVHLPYKNIASALNVSEKEARIRTTRSRVKLREAVEGVMARDG